MEICCIWHMTFLNHAVDTSQINLSGRSQKCLIFPSVITGVHFMIYRKGQSIDRMMQQWGSILKELFLCFSWFCVWKNDDINQMMTTKLHSLCSDIRACLA